MDVHKQILEKIAQPPYSLEIVTEAKGSLRVTNKETRNHDKRSDISTDMLFNVRTVNCVDCIAVNNCNSTQCCSTQSTPG